MKTDMQPRTTLNVGKESGHRVRSLIIGAATLAVAYAVVQNVPDLVRYLKIRRM